MGLLAGTAYPNNSTAAACTTYSHSLTIPPASLTLCVCIYIYTLTRDIREGTKDPAGYHKQLEWTFL